MEMLRKAAASRHDIGLPPSPYRSWTTTRSLPGSDATSRRTCSASHAASASASTSTPRSATRSSSSAPSMLSSQNAAALRHPLRVDGDRPSCLAMSPPLIGCQVPNYVEIPRIAFGFRAGGKPDAHKIAARAVASRAMTDRSEPGEQPTSTVGAADGATGHAREFAAAARAVRQVIAKASRAHVDPRTCEVLIGLLAQAGPTTASDLAKYLDLNRSTVLHALRVLDDARLTEKVADAADARRQIRTLTSEGR